MTKFFQPISCTIFLFENIVDENLVAQGCKRESLVPKFESPMAVEFVLELVR